MRSVAPDPGLRFDKSVRAVGQMYVGQLQTLGDVPKTATYSADLESSGDAKGSIESAFVVLMAVGT
jgi:hypothetical protein